MYKTDPTYLYKFKNSSNYYFRINLNFFQKFGYHNTNSHFVGSLKTSIYKDAKFLAMYIKRMIDKEFSMEAKILSYEWMGNGYSEESVNRLAEMSEQCDIEFQSMALQKQLREKFNRLYQTGLQLISDGYGHEPDHFVMLSKEQEALLEKKLDKANEQARSLTDRPVRNKLVAVPNQHSEIDKKVIRAQSEIAQSDNVHDYSNALMIADLMEQLMHKAKSYRNTANTTELTPSQMLEFMDALYEQQKIKVALENELETNAPKPDVVYTVGNQFSLFLKEKTQELAEQTISAYKAKFDVFFEIIDKEIDVRKFGKLEVQRVKTKLIERNANETKGADNGKMSAKTINMYLSNYRTFFSWLKNSVEGMPDNPFEGVSVKENKKNKIKRRAFTDKEVTKLLNYTFKHGSEAREFREDAKWFVPIAIYSGMRLNEISELTTKNVVKKDEVWCFDLIGMEVKNEPSNRVVPIAQYLLDMGLLEYVDKLNSKHKNKRKVLLFPQLRKNKKEAGNSGWGEPISRWFNRTALTNIGIDCEEEERRKTSVCFHCIRHTFISKMVYAGCQKHHIKRIVGHSVEDDITISVYSDLSNLSLSLLKSEMDEHLTWHLEG